LPLLKKAAPKTPFSSTPYPPFKKAAPKTPFSSTPYPLLKKRHQKNLLALHRTLFKKSVSKTFFLYSK
jgi:hypothetical protein